MNDDSFVNLSNQYCKVFMMVMNEFYFVIPCNLCFTELQFLKCNFNDGTQCEYENLEGYNRFAVTTNPNNNSGKNHDNFVQHSVRDNEL